MSINSGMKEKLKNKNNNTFFKKKITNYTFLL